MKTRIIHTKLWNDSFFSELTPPEKLLFIYLLTNESMNILHVYECSDRTIMFDTGITKSQLDVAKVKLEESGKMFFYHGYVYVKNADKYEDYIGEKYDKAKETLKLQIGSEVVNYFLSKNRLVGEGLETSQRLDISHNTKDISNKLKYIGVVKGEDKTSKNSLTPCTDVELEEIATKLSIRLLDVKQKHERILEMVESGELNKRKYKTLYYTLKSWLDLDIKKGFLRKVEKSVAWIQPTEEIPMSDEQISANFARLAAMKSQLLSKSKVN